MANVKKLPLSSWGWTTTESEDKLLDAEKMYVGLAIGLCILYFVIPVIGLCINLYVNPALNFILLFVGIFGIIFVGFVPFNLILVSLAGGVTEVAKDGEDQGFIRGNFNGLAWWARQVVASGILGYLIIMLDLSVTPYAGHPKDFFMFVGFLALLLVATIALGKKIGNFLWYTILVVSIIYLFVSHGDSFPASVKNWFVTPNFLTSESSLGTGITTRSKPVPAFAKSSRPITLATGETKVVAVGWRCYYVPNPLMIINERLVYEKNIYLTLQNVSDHSFTGTIQTWSAKNGCSHGKV